MIAIVPPSVLLGLVLSALYAGLFHVWGGRTLRDLVLFLLASIVGFALGQMIGLLLNLPLLQIGRVHVLEASLFAWIFMIGVRELGYGQAGQEADGL